MLSPAYSQGPAENTQGRQHHYSKYQETTPYYSAQAWRVFRGRDSSEEALDVYTDQLDPDVRVALKAKWRLAWTLHDQGKYKEAEQMSFETGKAQTRAIGWKPLDCIKSLFLFAKSSRRSQSSKELLYAKRLVRVQAVALLGPRHRYTFFAASSLASCLVASASATLRIFFGTRRSERLVQRRSERSRIAASPGSPPETLAARTDVA